MGASVNKMGKQSGWTTGQITGTCVDKVVATTHPDGVVRSTRLPCHIQTNLAVRVGDSRGTLFSLVYDPDPESGGFLGITSTCLGCSSTYSTNTASFVSWAAAKNALTNNISLVEDTGGPF
jgi:hypothetical protein